MSAPRLVLASTSRYRRDVLLRLGVPFEVAAPEFDERAPLPPGVTTIAETAVYLAAGKARSVAARPEFRDAWIIGSDQIAALDGEVLHKPGTVERAIDQLSRMRGRAHELVTAVVVQAGNRVESAVDTHLLHVKPLSDAAIARYVALDAPLDCAGSYRIEARGLMLMGRIVADPECADSSAIMGLPLWKLLGLFCRLGFDPLA